MANANTQIEWTDATWSPVTGCTKVSAGCKFCYAERVFPRAYSGMCTCGHKEEAHDHNDFSVGQGIPAVCFHEGCNCARFNQRQFSDVRTHPDRLDQPLHWKKPRRVFVNSMSDLFHEDVPDDFFMDVFATMTLCGQHTFQVLTKRPERMQQWCSRNVNEFDRWPLPNVWLGVSVEDQKTADERIALESRSLSAAKETNASTSNGRPYPNNTL